jgi:HEPN domain-containing protein
MADSKEAADWVRYAENDLEYALLGIERFPSQAAFHCHQSAEKHLKAVFLHRGILPPRSHDLTELLLLLEPAIAPASLEIGAARLLSVVLTPSKYPDDLLEITSSEAQATVEAARVLRLYARAKLGLETS